MHHGENKEQTLMKQVVVPMFNCLNNCKTSYHIVKEGNMITILTQDSIDSCR